MEKRRNTLDRWQRLRFGRRAASNPPEEKKPSSPELEAAAVSKRSSDKTERLRELTELLSSPRMAPKSFTPPSNRPEINYQASRLGDAADVNEPTTSLRFMNDDAVPPPVPPPRKPRQSNAENSSCGVEKFIDTSASESGSPVAGTKMEHLIEQPSLIESLRPNSSLSSLETMMRRQKAKDDTNKLPIAEENSLFSGQPVSAVSAVGSSAASELLPRAEARPPIVGAYTQKAIPFRSASFSQVDYSSGKYIRSALGALKASFVKSKSPPVVDISNPPLLRSSKDCSRSPSPLVDDVAPTPPPLPPYDIWIPLKPMPVPNSSMSEKCSARNDLNLNLLGATSANVIMEEDNEYSPTADSNESKYTMPMIVETANDEPSLKIVQAAQMSIDPLSEEEMVAIQTPEDYFQTATTCMIPVPVYECNLRDWVDANLADQWINACEIDSAKIVEEVKVDAQQIITVDDDELPRFLQQTDSSSTNCKSPDILINEALPSESEHIVRRGENDASKVPAPTLDLDDVPAIAVTPGSSISGSSFDEESTSNSNVLQRDDRTASTGECGGNAAANVATVADYVVEVRKRYSNDETRNSDNTQSSSGSGKSSPKCNLDEKRRIDKSKRRKGIYIQWAALDKHNKPLNTMPTADASPPDNHALAMGLPNGEMTAWSAHDNRMVSAWSAQDIGGGGDGVSSEPLWPLPVTAANTFGQVEPSGDSLDDEAQTPGSFEATSPDSEYSRPAWPKDAAKIRRQSFSLQSSEEKDESPAASSPPTKAHAKLFVLRSDSISDNELSDRTPPPRERASQSPAPGEQDLKRYSKRPLRGPYGQMLEAEMKKPNKQNYDGLLEELNRAER